MGTENYRALMVHASYSRDLVDSLIYMFTNVPLIIIFSFCREPAEPEVQRPLTGKAIFFLPVILTSGVMLVIDSGDLLQSSLGMTQTDGQEGAWAVELARLLQTRLVPGS